MNLESVVKDFSDQGYCLFEVEDGRALAEMSEFITRLGQKLLGEQYGMNEVRWRETIHKRVAPSKLNDFRLAIIQGISEHASWQSLMYSLASEAIDAIVGNELAAQRCCNLSIQLPHDTSSVLPLHSDVWSGNSPYEIVLWVPLVDCRRSQCMYILPRDQNEEIINQFPQYQALSAEALYGKISNKVKFIEINYGQALIFWHSLLHGNRVNQEAATRWSMNFRFKSLLSPYGNKGLGESFVPFSIKPLTRLGYAYREPDIEAVTL